MNSNFTEFNNFKGLGDPKSGIWFVGLEEGGNSISSSEIDKKVQECKKFPFYVPPTEMQKIKTPVWDFISKFLTKFYGLPYLDWKLCRNRMLSYEIPESDFENITLSNISFPKVFLTELFPLPKKRYKMWVSEYGELFGLKISDKKKYIEYVRLKRFPMLIDLWSENKPALTVCYGKSGWGYFKELFLLNDEIPEVFNNGLHYKTKNIILIPFLGNGQMSNDKIMDIVRFSWKHLLDKRKNNVLNYVKSFDSIVKYFTLEFLEKIILEYNVTDDFKFAKSNFILSNLLMSHYCKYNEKSNFVSKLSDMLVFFDMYFPIVINSPDTISRLKSCNNANFQGKWSELSYAYYLYLNNIKILDIDPKNNKGDELTDIQTENGSYEVTTLQSNSLINIEESPMFYSSDFSDGLIRIVNRKIEEKEIQNKSDYIAIDCIQADEIRNILFINNFIKKIDFDVFKKISKRLILLFRDIDTEQIVYEKTIWERNL